VGAALSALGLVFIAEAGDKSMLLVLALSARHSWRVLGAAVAVSAALLMALAVALGEAADAILPDWALATFSAVVFIGFGLHALIIRADEEDDERAPTAGRTALMTVLVLTAAFMLAELGDKTQIATLALSGIHESDRIGIWAGATIGLIAADALAMIVGVRLTRRIGVATLRRVSGVLFMGFGVVSVVLAAT
jgi:putative Ca2+/H+ antiporter (TMEM165/GDT1 family)